MYDSDTLSGIEAVYASGAADWRLHFDACESTITTHRLVILCFDSPYMTC